MQNELIVENAGIPYMMAKTFGIVLFPVEHIVTRCWKLNCQNSEDLQNIERTVHMADSWLFILV